MDYYAAISGNFTGVSGHAPSSGFKITTTCCVITKESTVPSYFMQKPEITL
jgi:hypothetical protein